MLYKFEMYETCIHKVVYTVEADNHDEAQSKAILGETESEDNRERLEVIERVIVSAKEVAG